MIVCPIYLGFLFCFVAPHRNRKPNLLCTGMTKLTSFKQGSCRQQKSIISCLFFSQICTFLFCVPHSTGNPFIAFHTHKHINNYELHVN